MAKINGADSESEDFVKMLVELKEKSREEGEKKGNKQRIRYSASQKSIPILAP